MLRYFMGLDLGQAQDSTATTILDRQPKPAEGKHADGTPKVVYQYQLRHLERFPLGTSYPAIVEKVKTLLTDPLLQGQTALVVDATGVGAPVVDLLRQEQLRPVRCIIHGGSQLLRDEKTAAWHVPKRELVSITKVLFQQGRLQFAESLPEVRTLIDELLHFEVKITDSGNDVYGAWRQGSHDDEVFALCLAAWYAEHLAGWERYHHDNPTRQREFKVIAG